MAANKKVLSLPGDGIGPEVMRQVGRVIEWFDRRRIATFDVTEGLVGGAALDAHGVPLTDETMRVAQQSDAVLFGAVGGPKWDALPFNLKPERKRGRKLTSVEKANVMHTGVLWRDEVTKLHAAEYQDVELSHMYADNCAMQLVRNPKQFDVIVTDNLFGDILSDCAAMLTGSLGMLPSASLGAADSSGRRKALYEPVHGSAPDIAGKGVANPLACILSFAMMLRYSFDLAEEADLVEKSVAQALAAGARTADIRQPNTASVSTPEMGDTILRELEKAA